ncbi:hypothetical protein HX92_2065 [Mycobacterium tuberculosis]|nr:hypothetical protein BCGT_0832 [Mycobacterium tuberculosis variant bovis BCG str. ATCC 35743]AIB47608.1 hypothetical protein MTBK_10620 [Mycobacterium tuberculosis K]AKR00668.1 hypothetical protein Mb1595_p1145 [Mycobacterium tuberculosis variant bovis]ALA77449.1 Uncharacterized protein BCGR_1132 [Mycobacterium tuberculosis variant bovis BCG]AOZ42135.1 hypothetical protein BTB1458_1129 [Mycobacterium tuberculosis]EQM18121.1 hypothetical protein FJ05194_3406 [Mycobacterium tuberculosis FJ051
MHIDVTLDGVNAVSTVNAVAVYPPAPRKPIPLLMWPDRIKGRIRRRKTRRG